MEDTRQVTTPEEMHSDLREMRRERDAMAATAASEIDADLATEAEVRAGVQTEEAERWGGVITDEERIREVMTRAVAQINVREELEKQLRSGRKLRVKLGIDPTGPRLHIGRTVPLFKMRQFQEMGHQVVLIIGDFTALVGDASDKDTQRPMLTREQIEANMETYVEQIGKILDIGKVEFRYNSQWLASLNFNDVIRLASKFTVAQMIQRENFSERWEQGKPIGLHEILYPLMQGFDSVAIEADVELGGTDQLFNLMAGRALQESFDQHPQSVLCTNMIPGTDGRKMSTSWGNAIYLLDEPRDQFGKIMSMGDEVITTYMEACTRLPMSEVERVSRGLEDGSVHPMDAKKSLAWEIVRMYHGEAAANEAKENFEAQFQHRAMPSQVPIVHLASGTINPVFSLSGSAVTTIGIVDLLVREKWARSPEIAQRLIEQGAVHVNDELITDPQHIVEIKDDTTLEVDSMDIIDLLIRVGLAPSRKHAQRLIEQGAVRVNDEPITDRQQIVRSTSGTVVKVGRSFVKIGD